MQLALHSGTYGEHATGFVRPLEEADILDVERLYLKVYGDKYATRLESLHRDLSRILLHNPWHDKRLPSLVFQDGNGDIVGCVGVLPRPMLFNGRRITAAVTHSLMVEPGSRSTLAAIHLVKRFFSGPQDLSLADVNMLSRRMWESAGGMPSLLYGLCWMRLLRPSRYVLSFLRNRGAPNAMLRLLSPFCSLADAVAPLVAKKFLRLARPETQDDEFDARTLHAELPGLTRDRNLRPEYTEAASIWLVEALLRNRRYGALHKRVVRGSQGRIIGWYLYFIKPSGIAEVAQLVATANSADAVLDSLFYHAQRQGAIAVTGQVDPPLLNSLSDKFCVFHPIRDGWVMLHSRHPEILQTINAGKAFLSRLESEWWISSILG